jgi:citrate lyase beta subunit
MLGFRASDRWRCSPAGAPPAYGRRHAGRRAAGSLFAAESAEAAAMGFTGKLVIHPSQVDIVNTSFLPSADEIAYASGVMAAAKGAPGAFRFQDKMIDAPHLKSATRILALADAHRGES